MPSPYSSRGTPGKRHIMACPAQATVAESESMSHNTSTTGQAPAILVLMHWIDSALNRRQHSMQDDSSRLQPGHRMHTVCTRSRRSPYNSAPATENTMHCAHGNEHCQSGPSLGHPHPGSCRLHQGLAWQLWTMPGRCWFAPVYNQTHYSMWLQSRTPCTCPYKHNGPHTPS